MNKKTSAHYQREYRRRLREQGLVKKEVWINQDHAKTLHRLELQLRQPGSESLPASKGAELTQAGLLATWTTQSLFDALAAQPDFSANNTLELIDDAQPSIHLDMKQYGDLPVYLAVCGEQIIVESLLWPLSEVKNSAQFNEMLLKTHKFIPLSSVGLETFENGATYYYMFGALSAGSLLANIIFEIDCLGSNVIQATQAFSEFLKSAIPLDTDVAAP
ncbi:MAG: YjfI family protein [Cellvibrionaceae bacterium]|nr:YjfI family protein [Cellvibrionaceae bacterium]